MRFWLSGRLVPADEARVGVLDHGFLVGDGVFETLKTVVDPSLGVVPFAMDRHIARLAASAAGIGMEPFDAEEVRHALLEVCRANPELVQGARLRVTLTSGVGPLGSDRAPGGATLAVAASPAAPWPPTTRLAVAPWPRNERSALVGVKSTSYAENVVALAWAKARGADEALLENLAGHVCEGTGSNVFLVRDGVITTPTLSSGCLAGITRALVLEWGARAGMPVAEVDHPAAAIGAAEEVFITSSTRDVHPVAQLRSAEGVDLWTGESPGPLTRAIAQVFEEGIRADWNP